VSSSNIPQLDDSIEEAFPPLSAPAASPFRTRLGRWLFEGPTAGAGPHHHQYPWWKVICLTGVDYFSTLGYQPGIAALAAGALAPVATLFLVLVTLFVAYPVYAEVAEKSPHGQGSIEMLQRLLPRWRGKIAVLILLGFAFTDFIITITLSAADSTAHIVENPFVPEALHHPVLITLLLLAALGVIFLRGFREAIGLAVVIVAAFMFANLVVLAVAVYEVVIHPEVLPNFRDSLFRAHGSPWTMLAVALILFPKLALGLSGFETGVTVMPLVKGDPGDHPERPAGRIRNTRKLLFSAALTMSVLLLLSSLTTTLLIPAAEFEEGGQANGRALAYIAHKYLGPGFGTFYDISTIVILWFAGASAMAALLNLVPRYLPPYGMAPDWARANRPLVLVFTAITFVVTILFEADVTAQGGAYATGVLVLMTSASLAVTIEHWQGARRWVYLLMTVIFVYTLLDNIHERPEGIKIASFFIVSIVFVSLLSRALRSTELRIDKVVLSDRAAVFVDEAAPFGLRLIAHRPDKRTEEEYGKKEQQARDDHSLDRQEPILFLEVLQGDASDFSEDLHVRGAQVGRHRVLRCTSPAIPNAIAALLLHLRDRTGRIPDAYFGWTEGNPVSYVLRYLALGEGDTAPVTREVLRRTVKNPLERPRIHVG
jgi:amino acid permease